MKKGFTLVELLAVIAILAILIIIALPNILEMFNNAKKDSFVTEARSIYKSAQQKYIADGGVGYIYTNIDDEYDELNMSGRTDYDYWIEFNDDGNIVFFMMYDDNYCYYNSTDGEPVNIEDIIKDVLHEGNDYCIYMMG
jgi:prepilin-type N-terminal cleavage/methylation domain-containing protein